VVRCGRNSVSLPPFRDDNWLPEGHHPTTWEEIVAVFGGVPGSKRAQVLADLLDWRDRGRAKGITGQLILDGSFISAKPKPGDFDTILVLDEGMEAILANDVDAGLLVNYAYCKQHGWAIFLSFRRSLFASSRRCVARTVSTTTR